MFGMVGLPVVLGDGVGFVAAGIGGSLAGDNFRPVSRLGEFNIKQFVKKYCEGDQPIPVKEMIKLFIIHISSCL